MGKGNAYADREATELGSERNVRYKQASDFGAKMCAITSAITRP